MTTPADIKAVFTSLAGHRVTAQEIADILGISRNATNSRLKTGLDSEDIINISRELKISPVEALVELEKLTRDEVFDYLDGGDVLLATASLEQVVFRLADETLSNVSKVELGAAARALMEYDELEQRRKRVPSAPESMPLTAVADDSPDEDALRGDEYD